MAQPSVSPRPLALSPRPFTTAGFVSMHSPRNTHLNSSFGSTTNRYSQSVANMVNMQSSTYLKSRGEQMARSTCRERAGALGNTPSSIVGYSSEGTLMRGVTSFPFEKQQCAYIDDFTASTADRLGHPFSPITEINADSSAHNIMTGSAFGGKIEGESTYKRNYKYGVGSKGKPFVSQNSPGLRAEEMITVGQFTSIPGLRGF